MSKKKSEREEEIINIDESEIASYDEKVDSLKDTVKALKKIKRRQKKLKKLEREKKEIIKKMRKKNK